MIAFETLLHPPHGWLAMHGLTAQQEATLSRGTHAALCYALSTQAHVNVVVDEPTVHPIQTLR